VEAIPVDPIRLLDARHDRAGDRIQIAKGADVVVATDMGFVFTGGGVVARSSSRLGAIP
jgi:hypothetical protein